MGALKHHLEAQACLGTSDWDPVPRRRPLKWAEVDGTWSAPHVRSFVEQTVLGTGRTGLVELTTVLGLKEACMHDRYTRLRPRGPRLPVLVRAVSVSRAYHAIFFRHLPH